MEGKERWVSQERHPLNEEGGKPSRLGGGPHQAPWKTRGQYYLSRQMVDTDHGIILDVRVTLEMSMPLLPMEYVHRAILPI